MKRLCAAALAAVLTGCATAGHYITCMGMDPDGATVAVQHLECRTVAEWMARWPESLVKLFLPDPVVDELP